MLKGIPQTLVLFSDTLGRSDACVAAAQHSLAKSVVNFPVALNPGNKFMFEFFYECACPSSCFSSEGVHNAAFFYYDGIWLKAVDIGNLFGLMDKPNRIVYYLPKSAIERCM